MLHSDTSIYTYCKFALLFAHRIDSLKDANSTLLFFSRAFL
jgi:hypothetical protein